MNVRGPLLRCLFALSLLGSMAAAAPASADSTTGDVAVTKTMCTSIGDQNTCNGRDTSLDTYKVDFKVYAGSATGGTALQTITVTLGQNAGGGGSTGGGSQGRAIGSPLSIGTYTVCEIPTAYKGAISVRLSALARPNNSSGGSNQSSSVANCITVSLTAGTAELDFLDRQVAPTPTSTPTNTPVTPVITVSPETGTATPTNTPVTPVITVSPESGTVTPTATPRKTATSTPDVDVLPETGDPGQGTLALFGLTLTIGGLITYRVSGSRRAVSEVVRIDSSD